MVVSPVSLCIVTDVTMSHDALCATTKELFAVEAVNGRAVFLCTKSGVFVYVSAFDKLYPAQCGKSLSLAIKKKKSI